MSFSGRSIYMNLVDVNPEAIIALVKDGLISVAESAKRTNMSVTGSLKQNFQLYASRHAPAGNTRS